MEILFLVIQVVVLIVSVILHEVAHGAVALFFGDDTAKRHGRLTLNPIPHFDLVGSFIVPAVLILTTGFAFGWAKPVPVNFRCLRPQKLGAICVSLAGVATNLILAILFAGLFRLLYLNPFAPVLLLEVIFYFVYVNLLLGILNLLPIPPIDGSRLWLMWLPEEAQAKIESFALLFFVLIFVLFSYLPIGRIIVPILTFLTGMQVV